MLVLSRQRDESIIIGDNIIITIVDIRGDKVRLGIEAPQEVPVHRQEVYEAIHGPGQYQLASAGPRTWAGGAADQEVNFVEISVGQLVHELGATDADVDRMARFTSEGNIPP